MPRSGSVLDRAGAGVHLQLAGHGCDAIHVAEGAIHGQLLVQVLATAAVGFHGSNSNDVDTVMLARANALVSDNGYESPIDLLNSCDADESDEKTFESDPVSPAWKDPETVPLRSAARFAQRSEAGIERRGPYWRDP